MIKKNNHLETFGSYIRGLRIKQDIGQREWNELMISFNFKNKII